MNTVFESMLSAYSLKNQNEKKNAMKEVTQEILLCGLSRAGFFEKASFYGGTALRIFHGLNRYSEDLDFSLREADVNFDFKKYLPLVEEEVNSFGLNMKVETKEKNVDTFIKSAFLKGNTKEHLLYFYDDDSLVQTINHNEMIKIKFEVDVNPPKFATFETIYRLLPSPYEAVLYDMPSLFAGKIAAVLCRAWKNRAKGRDLYDYIFYLQKNTPFNLKHLQARLTQNGFIQEDKILDLDDVKNLLKKHFDSIDFEDAKKDVYPFIKDVKILDVWNSGFFKSITEQIRFC